MAKTGIELANGMLRKQYPEDIEKGFRNLGYGLSDIDKEYENHKKDLFESDPEKQFNDAQVYAYMRQHLKDGGIAPNPNESLDNYRMRLGRHPTNDEYRNWLKPKIRQRVGEYKNAKMKDKLALDELMDEFGYEDLVNEGWYGRPKRSDAQVWRDRAMKLPVDTFPIAVEELSDDQINAIIKSLGFDRRGEW